MQGFEVCFFSLQIYMPCSDAICTQTVFTNIDVCLVFSQCLSRRFTPERGETHLRDVEALACLEVLVIPFLKNTKGFCQIQNNSERFPTFLHL